MPATVATGDRPSLVIALVCLLALTSTPSVATQPHPVGATVGPTQSSPPSSLEEAKAEALRVRKQLSTLDAEMTLAQEREVSAQVSTAPKGEFETTQEYQERVGRAATVRAKLKEKYGRARGETRRVREPVR